MITLALLKSRCIVDSDNGCWSWNNCIQSNGYGRIRINGKTRYTHRIAYELAFGPAPTGSDVCHHCDNRRCCNPEHLFAGTRLQNMRDADSKGRISRGPRHSAKIILQTRARGKLNLDKARLIRKLRIDGQRTDDLARLFDVDISTVRLVIAGKTWREFRWFGLLS